MRQPRGRAERRLGLRRPDRPLAARARRRRRGDRDEVPAGGFSGLAGSGPARALTDRTVTLPEAFGDDGEALERALEDAISVEAVVGAVEALVRRRRPPADPGRDLAMAAVEHMRSAPPRTSIAAVAAHAGLSPRALQRLFARHVGATPKQVLQRFRLQDAVDEVGRGEDSLARLAADLGYYDQAHFVRDFRTTVGRSPSAYVELGTAG